MTRQVQIYILLALTLGVGVVLYFNNKKENAFVNPPSNASLPQITVVPDDIDKLTVKSKDKPEVVLERKLGVWTMTAPHPTQKLEKKAIDDVLNGLKGISFKESIAKGKENFDDKDLVEGKGTHVVASKGPTVVMDIWLGKAPTAGQLARITNDDNIYVITGTGASSFTYDKGEKDFRDKKVWDLPKDQIVAVSLKDAKGDFSFTKNEATAPAATDAGGAGDAIADAAAPPSWIGLSAGKPMVGLDTSKVDDLVNAYALGGVLNADDFGDGKSDAETGLASPDATTLTFKMKDGATRKLLLGKTDGTKRYARTEAEPSVVYLLAEGPSGWADVGVDKFVPAPPAAADAGAEGGAADAKK